MSNLTNYTEDKILDHIFGVAAFTMPTTVYVGLFTADPGEAGSTASELSTATGYARKAATFSASSSGNIALSAQISFGPNTTTDWGIISHFAVFDASTGGNMLAYGPVNTPKTFTVGDMAFFNPNDLQFTAD